MKKKLLAVVLSVVMIAALLVPMMAISAANAPTAKIGLGEATIWTNNQGVDYVTIPVNISENNGTFFAARYQIVSKEGLKPFNFRNGDFKEEIEDDFGDVQTITLGLTVKPGTFTDRLQVVQDSSSGTEGIKTASGNLGTAYFEAPTEPGTYTFELVWLDGADNTTAKYSMTVAPSTATYTIKAVEHTFGEPVITKEADCENAGEKVTTCTTCGEEIKETIPALGHDWDNGVTAEDVKCGDTADTTYTCQREGCGETRVEVGAVVPHDMVADEANSKAATCTEDGVEATKCTRCDHTETKVIEKLGHDMVADEANSKAATCTEDGVEATKCTRCDHTETKVIEKLGHDMVADEANSKAATCYAEGVEATKCTRCDYTETKAIEMIEHDFSGEVVITKKPTADAKGAYTVACANDGCTETEEYELEKLSTEVKFELDGKVLISFKSDEAILPEDVMVDSNGGEKDEATGKITEEITFVSEIIDDLAGKVEFSVNTTLGGKFDSFEVYVKSGDKLEAVDFALKDGMLTFDADLEGTYVLVYKEVKSSPDTSDATNTVVFAVAALMAVAGLVVVGKKRFAL